MNPELTWCQRRFGRGLKRPSQNRPIGNTLRAARPSLRLNKLPLRSRRESNYIGNAPFYLSIFFKAKFRNLEC